MSSLPKLESTSHADWSRTNFTTQPPRGVWGYAASASPSTPFQTASRYRGQGGVSSTKSHLAPRSSLLSVQKCSAHGIDAALPQPSNWLAWPKRSLKPPNANDSDQPEPTVRGLAPGGRCWPEARDRYDSPKLSITCSSTPVSDCFRGPGRNGTTGHKESLEKLLKCELTST